MWHIQREEAERFLAAISTDREFTFQTFDDSLAKQRTLNRTAPFLHGTFERLCDRLCALNLKGAGVFVMVNRGDGKGRKAVNVNGCRALFLDLDGAPLEPVMGAKIAPSIVVESSPGRFHCYWPCVDLPLDRFRSAQKALAATYSGDAKVHDLPRVLRVPGFIHAKETKGKPIAPFVSRLIRCEDTAHTWTELSAAFGLAARFTLPREIPDGQRNDTLFQLAAAARRSGTPQAQQLEKLLKVNAERCQPPLPLAEVEQIVASAYSAPSSGAVHLPHEVMDSPAYRALSHGAQVLYSLALRKSSGFTNGNVALVHSEMRPWFNRENTFEQYREELKNAGLVAITKRGKGGRPNLYTIKAGGDFRPIAQPKLGADSALPEALQAVAVEKLQGVKKAAGASNDEAGAA